MFIPIHLTSTWHCFELQLLVPFAIIVATKHTELAEYDMYMVQSHLNTLQKP